MSNKFLSEAIVKYPEIYNLKLRPNNELKILILYYINSEKTQTFDQQIEARMEKG
jgi:hypothetical protein